MSAELYGLNPTSEKGIYFYNCIWKWRPIWEIARIWCDDFITEEELILGHHNQGFKIGKGKSLKLAKRFKKALKYKPFKDLDKDMDWQCNLKLPEEIASIDRNWVNQLDGVPGNKFPFGINVNNIVYIFSIPNLKQFIEFAQSSGGFEIW